MAANVLGTRVEKPQWIDMTAGKRMLLYLNGTKEWHLALKPGDEDHFVVFADSNWKPKDDKQRRSRIEIMIQICTAQIFTVSKTQRPVSLRSSKAGNSALAETATTIVWFQRVLNDRDVGQIMTTIAQDNDGAIKWAEGGPAKHFT